MAKMCSLSQHKVEDCLVYVDSACRENPGHAAVGAIIKAHPKGKLSVMWRASKSIGKKTKIEAEFEALLFGMERALQSQYKHVLVMSVSDVMVKQYYGHNEVPSAELGSLLQRAKDIAKQFCQFSLKHIPKSANTDANAEANRSLYSYVPSGRLQEDSSCPVCLELFEPPVFQCPNGHLICKECLDDLFRSNQNQSCPECRTPYGGMRIRCVVADDLIKQWRPQKMMERSLATYKLSPEHTFVLRESPQSNSSVDTIKGGTYIDVNEIKVTSEENTIIGRTSSGNWIKLQPENQLEVLAVAIPLGTYEVSSEAVLSADVELKSVKTNEKLQPGDYVDIIETKVVTKDERVRAKTSSGKWMSLVNTTTGFKWASPLSLGTYKIKSSASLSLGAQIGSGIIDQLSVGDYVDIVDTKVVPEDQRVRAKTANGKWMSLMNTTTRFEWASPLSLGTYKIKSAASLSRGAQIGSGIIDQLLVDDFVDIVDTKVVPEDKRVRAKTANGKWMSLVNTTNGFEWASIVPLGAYKVDHFARLALSVKMDSEKVGELQDGDYVEITQTKVVPEANRVRAKTGKGDWLSLVNLLNEFVWASPLPLGTYKVQKFASLTVGCNLGSERVGQLQVGEYVDIAQTTVVSESNRVRAKTEGGMWMSLVDTKEDFVWALPLPLGSYKVMKFAHLSVGAEIGSEKVGELQVGDYVDIAQTKVIPGASRVRARTTSGMWMSVANIEDGSVWAKPREIVEKEEENAALRARTCNECNREFIHSRAMYQHYEDCHQFWCQHGCGRAFKTRAALIQHNSAKH